MFIRHMVSLETRCTLCLSGNIQRLVLALLAGGVQGEIRNVRWYEVGWGWR
jgi:hypothetical protein